MDNFKYAIYFFILLYCFEGVFFVWLIVVFSCSCSHSPNLRASVITGVHQQHSNLLDFPHQVLPESIGFIPKTTSKKTSG